MFKDKKSKNVGNKLWWKKKIIDILKNSLIDSCTDFAAHF